MSDKSYKLTYFDFAGIAEPIRFLFQYSGVPFEDERLQWDQRWTDELKHKFPWGTLPVLKYGELELSQSVAICRFLAKKFSIAGKNELESAKCDELVDVIADLRAEWVRIFIENDEAKKSQMTEEFKTKLSAYYTKFNTILKTNTNGGQYFVGNALTWTDLYIAYFLDFFNTDYPTVIDEFEDLAEFKKKMYELPSIKQWIESRPKDFSPSS